MLRLLDRRPTTFCSQRQRLAGLLLDDVLGVPIRPVHVVLTAVPLLVLAMGDRRTAQRRCKIR